MFTLERLFGNAMVGLSIKSNLLNVSWSSTALTEGSFLDFIMSP